MIFKTSPPNVIVITGYRRPHLFRLALESLSKNQLSGWRIAIQIEPTELVDQFQNMSETILKGCDYHLTINPRRLGIRANPFQALDTAFSSGAKGVLYLEEDLIISPDATLLSDWYFSRHEAGWLALCLLAGGCGTSGFISNPDYPNLLFPSRTFNSLGFAVRDKEWQSFFRAAWMKLGPARMRTFKASSPVGWDWQIYSLLVNHARLRVIQPVLARSKHNGREDGQFSTPAFHDRTFPHLPLATVKATSLEMTQIDALPLAVRDHAMLWDEMTDLRKQPRIERLHLLWRYYRERISRTLRPREDDPHRR